MSDIGKRILQSVKQARDFAEGKSTGCAVHHFHSVEDVDDTIFQAMIKIINLAKRYRQIEIEQTPYLCRGKKLHDTGNELSQAIEDYEALLMEE